MCCEWMVAVSVAYQDGMAAVSVVVFQDGMARAPQEAPFDDLVALVERSAVSQSVIQPVVDRQRD